MAPGRLVVCVPARNEAQRLPHLLEALAQQIRRPAAVVFALNNTTDRSREVIQDFSDRHPGLNIIADEITFSASEAHAGSARRHAMDMAADVAGPQGWLLATDADTRPPTNWVAQNSAAMSRGLDIVGGRIVLDEAEPIPERVRAMVALADRYWSRVREIEDAIDPVPWDPPPRHGDHTGASLCVTVTAYRRCGGVPGIRSGEDRALVKAVLRHGGKLAHPEGIWTRVSPRISGRAEDGMAEHMKRLQEGIATGHAEMLPSFSQWRARAEWRRSIRHKNGSALIAELEDELPPMRNDFALDALALGHTV